jgi:hypothetical protein
MLPNAQKSGASLSRPCADVGGARGDLEEGGLFVLDRLRLAQVAYLVSER